LLPAGKTMAPTSGHVLNRPRLEPLVEPVLGTLVLVQAPAGFGKTLSLFSSPGPWRRIWYNADGSDRDPRTLAERLAQALGVSVFAPRADANPAELAAALAYALPPGVVTLDVDGAERVGQAARSFAVLSELLSLASDRVALRMTTRSRPPIPLERLRLAGRLREVGPEDLRFELEEAQLFVEDVAGRRLGPAKLQELQSALDGWPAGLALCLLSDGAGARDDALQRYLADEVLAPVNDEVRALLTQIAAHPGSDPARLAETLPEGRRAWDWILAERFFVTPGASGYRLHPALSAFLRSQASRTPGAGPGDLGPVRRETDLEIRTLGAFEVRIGGELIEPAQWRPFGALRVLRVLLSQPHYTVTAEAAAEMLWPRHEAASALNSFNVSLHALRRILEPDLRRGAESRFIVRESRHYRLQVENIDLDVTRFLALARPARGVPTIKELEQAAALYRGDFLSDVLYMDYPNERREHLKTLYLETLEHLGDLLLETGAIQRGLAAYRTLLATDPLREDVWARLMRHHLGRGERAAAARAFRACEDALREDLGVTPADELQELMREAISGGQPPLEATELLAAAGSTGPAAVLPISPQ
jgi:DNA-binding SARP family transcriptional activator